MVVYEDNLTNGLGAEISAISADVYLELLNGHIKRVEAKDSPVEYKWYLEKQILPQTSDIVAALTEIVEY